MVVTPFLASYFRSKPYGDIPTPLPLKEASDAGGYEKIAIFD